MKENERLTARNKAGQAIIDMTGVHDELEARARIRSYSPLVIAKLCAYEETGLSPEEVEKLKAENAELRARLEKAVEDVAERIKAAFYYEFDEIIPSIMSDKIDEIVREASHDD